MVGIGILVGPVLEAEVLKRTGNNLRTPYAALAVLGATQFIVSWQGLRETLADAVPFSWESIAQNINPFSFLRIYQSDNTVFKSLVTCAALQQFTEGKNISDLGQLFQSNQLGWDTLTSRNFVTGYGIGVVFQGAVLTQRLVKALGVRAFTSLANLCMALGLAVMGSSHRSAIYLAGVLLTLPGLNGSAANGVRGVATAMAKEEGIHGGDFAVTRTFAVT